jgi:hypothetical protein
MKNFGKNTEILPRFAQPKQLFPILADSFEKGKAN